MTLADVRAEIDRIDDQVVGLLALRQRQVALAATYKVDDAAVRAPDRRAAVMRRLEERALAEGLHPEVARRTWTAMIDAFIEVELAEHARLAAELDELNGLDGLDGLNGGA